MPTLLSLGHGYSAQALADLLLPQGWTVIGTTRDPDRADELRGTGVIPALWPDDVPDALVRATHLLSSVAPKDGTDPVLDTFGPQIATAAPRLQWAGYLSTTGVYGDRGGDWVDETSDLRPTTERGRARVAAETRWQAIAHLPLHIFRLAGIYGPGRGPFAKVRAGTARRIVKPGQVFSRIHVADIALTLAASIDRPAPGMIYNLCDDDPAPPQDVIAHAAHLLGLPLPPAVDFATADLSPMARSFYAENKKVRNTRIKEHLGIALIHPDYRSGLAALLRQEGTDR